MTKQRTCYDGVEVADQEISRKLSQDHRKNLEKSRESSRKYYGNGENKDRIDHD